MTAPPPARPAEAARDARQAFVEALHRLHRRADDGGPARAALAELRRGLTDPTHPLVFRAVGLAELPTPADATGHGLDAHLMTAVLFARMAQGRKSSEMPRFPTGTPRRDLGASARRLRDGLGNGADSLDLRFAALLDRRFEDVFVPLRQLVHLLASKDVPVAFGVLLPHLEAWGRDPRRVRRRWAESYWRPAAAPPKETANEVKNPS